MFKMDKMDNKKKSQTKRNIESTDNKKKNQVKDKKQGKIDKSSKDDKNQGGNQSFCGDQKDSKNIICKKDSAKNLLKLNEAHNINTIDSQEDIEYKSLDNDDKNEWSIQRKNKTKNHRSLSKEQKYHKNDQKQSKLSDSNSKQNNTLDNNNIDLHENEDINKSETKRKKRQRNKKKKNSQEQNDISSIDSSDEKCKQTKVHDENNVNLHEEGTQNLSNDDLFGQRGEKKNGQNQRKFPNIDSSIEDKLNHKKVHDGDNINLHKDVQNLSNHDVGGRRNKNKNIKTSCQSLSVEQKNHKNVQKQSKQSGKNSNDHNMKQAHDGNKIDSYKDIPKSEGSGNWSDKYKNNGQKQSRFSDAYVLEEIDQDIFNLSNDYSLAHCVAEDLRMGAGIAVDFKYIFGGVGKLVDQKLKIGDVGVVQRHDQYAFYLVTKKTSNGKPTMVTMDKALRSLLNKMKEYNLTKLGIPKIGCGLDRLDWSDTKLLINNIFSGSGIHITVCVPSKLLDSKTPPRLTVYITPKHLWEMEAETIIILFIDLEKICNKNWTDHIVDKVDAKYPFKENLLRDVRNKKPDPGVITTYDVKNEIIICMFTTENKYYSSIEDGFKTIDHKFKRYKYLAIESDSIDYPNDNFQRISWIVLISRSVVRSSELWLCGNVKQNNYKEYYDDYCKNVLYMNNSFQYNSPNQKYNRYNDDRYSSFNTKETSYQH